MNDLDLWVARLWMGGIIYSAYTALSIPVATFLLAYAVPKSIVEKYFRQPYFNDGDDELFAHMPFRQILTIHIAAYTASKWCAGRRKLYGLRADCPTYWKVLAGIFFWVIFLPPLFAFILSILGYLYFEVTGRAIPPIS